MGIKGKRNAPVRRLRKYVRLNTDPHCTVDPNTVPKTMDVLTPPGVAQFDELDYTVHHPVTLEDIVIP